MAVTGVTGKNKTFIIIFATKSLIITCDNCDTLEWTVVVAILNDNVTHETSGTRIMVSNSLLDRFPQKLAQPFSDLSFARIIKRLPVTIISYCIDHLLEWYKVCFCRVAETGVNKLRHRIFIDPVSF